MTSQSVEATVPDIDKGLSGIFEMFPSRTNSSVIQNAPNSVNQKAPEDASDSPNPPDHESSLPVAGLPQSSEAVDSSVVGPSLALQPPANVEAAPQEASSTVNELAVESDGRSTPLRTDRSANSMHAEQDLQRAHSGDGASSYRDLVFNREDLTQLAQGNVANVDVELIAKFSSLCDPNGVRVFSQLPPDSQLRNFLRMLSRTEILLEKRKNADPEEESERNEWEDEEEEDIFDRSRRLWKKLKLEKRQMVLNLMCETSKILIAGMIPPQNEAEGQAEEVVMTETETEDGTESPRQQPLVVPAPSPTAASGLFTANFDWEKLPAALKTVYDKQGHRQEVIDGTTLWKFLTKCTSVPKTNDHSGFEPDPFAPQSGDQEEQSVEEGMTSEQFMEMLGMLMNAKAANEDVSQSEKSGDAGSDEDDDESQNQEAMLAQLMERLQDAGGNDVGMQMLMQLMGGGQGGMFGAQMPPVDPKVRKLEQFLAERRNDPDHQHIAEVWDQLLREDPSDVLDVRPTRFSKSFGEYQSNSIYIISCQEFMLVFVRGGKNERRESKYSSTYFQAYQNQKQTHRTISLHTIKHQK